MDLVSFAQCNGLRPYTAAVSLILDYAPYLTRAVAGGAISVAELEKIQALLQTRRMRVLYIAEGPERQQIETLLTQARARVRRISPKFFEQNLQFGAV